MDEAVNSVSILAWFWYLSLCQQSWWMYGFQIWAVQGANSYALLIVDTLESISTGGGWILDEVVQFALHMDVMSSNWIKHMVYLVMEEIAIMAVFILYANWMIKCIKAVNDFYGFLC